MFLQSKSRIYNFQIYSAFEFFCACFSCWKKLQKSLNICENFQLLLLKCPACKNLSLFCFVNGIYYCLMWTPFIQLKFPLLTRVWGLNGRTSDSSGYHLENRCGNIKSDEFKLRNNNNVVIKFPPKLPVHSFKRQTPYQIEIIKGFKSCLNTSFTLFVFGRREYLWLFSQVRLQS